MRANIDLDDTLLMETMKISGMNTKKAVLEMALKGVFAKKQPQENIGI